jgi:hypothetical protein
MLSLNLPQKLSGPTPITAGAAGAQKEGQPCPKGGLKSAGPCQNRTVGATLPMAQTSIFKDLGTSASPAASPRGISFFGNASDGLLRQSMPGRMDLCVSKPRAKHARGLETLFAGMIRGTVSPQK